jgi:TPR repeat protein
MSADQKDANAIYRLGKADLFGELGLPTDRARGLELLKRANKSGKAEAGQLLQSAPRQPRMLELDAVPMSVVEEIKA